MSTGHPKHLFRERTPDEVADDAEASAGGVLIAVLGGGTWLVLDRREDLPAPTPSGAGAPAEPDRTPPRRMRAPAAPGRLEPAPGDAARPQEDGPLHPHPITPRHERIFRENGLVGQLFGALDVKDGPGLRRLLEQYRREFPDDPQGLQEGYGIIADCLEHPAPATRTAGQDYYERERGSMLRRFVGRYCLDNGD